MLITAARARPSRIDLVGFGEDFVEQRPQSHFRGDSTDGRGFVGRDAMHQLTNIAAALMAPLADPYRLGDDQTGATDDR